MPSWGRARSLNQKSEGAPDGLASPGSKRDPPAAPVPKLHDRAELLVPVSRTVHLKKCKEGRLEPGRKRAQTQRSCRTLRASRSYNSPAKQIAQREPQSLTERGVKLKHRAHLLVPVRCTVHLQKKGSEGTTESDRPTLTIRPNRPISHLRFTLTASPFGGGSVGASTSYTNAKSGRNWSPCA